MPKAKTKAKQPKLDQYTVSLAMNNTTYKATAQTVLDALAEIKPEMLKTRGTFTVSQGKLASTLTLYPIQIKKLLANRILREIFQKRMVATLR